MMQMCVKQYEFSILLLWTEFLGVMDNSSVESQ